VLLKTRKKLLYSAIVASLGVGLAAGPVWAQQDADDQADEVEELADLERITVTGTRIQREGVDTFYPAITVDSQTLDDAAFTNVASALNQLPSFGPGVTPAEGQNTFAAGQNFVNFLGLGTQRTLTLVNGRRFVSSNAPILFGVSGGLQVDFNVIPIAVVDRVETIGVGGAPIYGSDAIAGTINVITKDRYEGFEVSYRHGLTEQGDNRFQQALMVAGANFDDGRGNVYASLEFEWQDPLEGTARPKVRDTSQFLEDDDGIRRIYRDRRINLFSMGGLVSDPRSGFGTLVDPAGAIGFGPLGIFPDGTFYQFDENSNLVPFTPGQVRPGSPFFATGGDGPSFFDEVEQINSEVERAIFTTAMNYDVTDNVRFSADFLFADTKGRELVNQGGFQSFAFGGFGDESGPILFSADNPFLPQQARDVLAANDVEFFALHRFNNDIIDSSINNDTSVWRVTAGFDGDFFLGDRRFNWEATFVHGETDIVNRREGIINDRFFNAIDVRQLTQADLDVVDADDLLALSGTDTVNVGDIICEGVYQGVLAGGVSEFEAPFISGCVPLNLFGEGARSEAARDWVTGDLINTSRLEQSIYTVSLGGGLFDLPGGQFSAVVGYERREEDAAFNPDAASEIGLSRSAPFPPTGGGYKTDEWFAEFSAPIVSPDMDITAVSLLEFNGAYRRVDNSLAGREETWTLGGRWAPMNGLTFRGNYTEAFRAPSLVELFTPVTQVFSFADDPCDNRFINSGPVPDVRRANCIADGVDAGNFTSNVVNATARGRSGGNPDLLNETSEAWSVGLTWEPEFIDNLLVTLDWVDIKLNDAILNLGLTSLMNACYDSEEFPDAVVGGPLGEGGRLACDAFVRDENNQVVDFLTGQTNASVLETARLEIGLNYLLPLGEIGDLGLQARISHNDSRRVSVVGEETQDTVGGWVFPKWSGQQDFIFTRDRHRVFYRVLWRQSAKLSISGDNEFERDDGKRVSRTRFSHLHNVAYSYEIPALFQGAPERTFVQFNVDNLFDRQPDTVARAANHFTFSELLGRRYTLSLRAQF